MFVCVCVCEYTHTKRPFPKGDKRQSKNQGSNANANVEDHVLEKNSSKLCKYVESYFPQHNLRNLH